MPGSVKILSKSGEEPAARTSGKDLTEWRDSESKGDMNGQTIYIVKNAKTTIYRQLKELDFPTL